MKQPFRWLLISSEEDWQCSGTAAQGVVGLPSLEVLKNHRDGALKDMVNGQGENELMAGFDDLHGLFQP